MKSNKLIFFFVCLFFILSTSCKTNDNEDFIADWKVKNETYFANMKDNVGYVLYTIPISRGGGSYYYKIISAGDTNSLSPTFNDFVKVNYRGKLIDGRVFDQSYIGDTFPNDSTGTELTIEVNKLIKGWTENLMQMKPGEKRRIVLPQELGYGGTYVSNLLLPYSTTIFDIQLIAFYDRD